MKKLFKSILFSRVFVWFLGSQLLTRLFLRNNTVVFLYHEISDTPSKFHRTYDLNVPPALFERQIRAIQDIFNTISADDIVHGNYKKPAALITFDDGTKGYFSNAFPVLERLNCPSLIFLNMGPVMGDIFWSGLVTYLCDYHSDFIDSVRKSTRNKLENPTYLYVRPEHVSQYLSDKDEQAILSECRTFYGEFMDTSDLSVLDKSPLTAFGNHLYNHYNCVNSNEREIVDNYRKNQGIINEYSNGKKLFSYPFGQLGSSYNSSTNDLIRDLGAELIFTAHSGNFHKNQNLFHRFSMTEHMKDEKYIRTALLIAKIQQVFGNSSSRGAQV